jgi:sodium/hydrogen antiporter
MRRASTRARCGATRACPAGIALYAALSLTLVRMLPVALGTARIGFRASTVAFMGWFGPRGLASIILALVVAEEEPDLPGLNAILATVTVTVLASVAPPK